MIENCLNCQYCIPIPRNNKYGDIDYLCAVNEYFISNLKIDHRKIKQYSPGGKELKCTFKERKNDISSEIRNTTGSKP